MLTYTKKDSSYYLASGYQSRNLTRAQKFACMFCSLKGLSGIAILLIGAVFCWIFFDNIKHSLFTIQNKNEFLETSGKIQGTSNTDIKENNSYICRYYFIFTVNEKNYENISYSSNKNLTPGTNVKIKYHPDDPARSHIVGMRSGSTEIDEFSLILSMTFLAFVLLLLSYIKGRKIIHLLQWGEVTKGTLIKKTLIPIRVNILFKRAYLHKYTFEYINNNFSYSTSVINIEDKILPQNNGEKTDILYDPLNPALARVKNTLPAGLSIDEKNKVVFKPRYYKPIIATTFIIIATSMAILIAADIF